MFNVSDYDYDLPEELIAYYPPEKRGTSRMLIMDRDSGQCEVSRFESFLDYLTEKDCIVMNNTKVIKARLYGYKEGDGARIESVLIKPDANTEKRWNCLMKPGKRVRSGTRVRLELPEGHSCGSEEWYTVIGACGDGTYDIEFDADDPYSVMDEFGHMPLPPYIKRSDEFLDEKRYQTVFAKESGSVAAPTAGLHFTDDIMLKLKEKGIKKTELTLHVGPGTFLPVSVDNIKDHKMHSERFSLSEKSAAIINETRKAGGKILSVGTTTTRVLETLGDSNGQIEAGHGNTDIFIYPPYKPKIVDMLITNFHLPKSTLMMLVSAFSSRDKVLKAYELAIEEKFRFYSYGDCMLLK